MKPLPRDYFRPLLAVVLCLCVRAVTIHAQNLPFPQHTTYTAGSIKPAVLQATMDQTNRLFYDGWKAAYLVNGCVSNHYYIRYRTSGAITVSEAHGYGMMIFALMAGYDANARTYFDGMYRYFTNHQSSITPYLMGWQQDTGCVPSSGGNDSATDGDLDIAYALLLADRQWGSSGTINYLAEGRKVIAAVMKGEINTNVWSVRLGDWTSSSHTGTRSSDFMPDHFRAFQTFGSNTNWARVVDKCYSIIGIIQTNNSPATGLMPDFIVNVNTTPAPAPAGYLEGSTDKDYAYNSCRVPWRIGTDYLVSGDPRAKAALDRINVWIQTKTSGNPANIKAGYTITNGTQLASYSDHAFTAPFAVGAMVNPSNQVWLNKLWTNLVSQPVSAGQYYDNSVKLLSLLVIAGNWWAPTPKPPRLTNAMILPGGHFTAQLEREPQFTNHLETSTNLLIWSPLFTTNPAASPVSFTDTQAAIFDRRFYRARQRRA